MICWYYVIHYDTMIYTILYRLIWFYGSHNLRLGHEINLRISTLRGWSHWVWICWTKEWQLRRWRWSNHWDNKHWTEQMIEQMVWLCYEVDSAMFEQSYLQHVWNCSFLGREEWLDYKYCGCQIAYAMSENGMWVNDSQGTRGAHSPGAVKNGHASGSTAFILTKVGHRKRDQLLQKESTTLKVM